MTARLFLFPVLLFCAICTHAQKYYARYFDEAIFTDTASTMFLPVRYNSEMLSDNKMSFWGDYYANIIVYNYTTDAYQKLFTNDCFIVSLVANNYVSHPTRKSIRDMTKDWIFLFVRQYDRNGSGRIDEKDPLILYAVTTKGDKLRALTDKNENAVSLQIFENQGFALVKMQRDSDNDGSFKLEDKEFYYRKIDLKDLSLGNAIELKPGL